MLVRNLRTAARRPSAALFLPMLRRSAASGPRPAPDGHDHDHDEHTHSHTHSIFRPHSHSPDAHRAGAEKIVAALQGSHDRGSRITIIGLFSNVALTAAKGAAGVYMHSASLLADAGHSLSDLLGDFVTLFCWRLSRAPPTERYPYGFAKFETLGTTTMALLLVGGALGIGVHSYHLLADALSATAASLPAGPLQDALANATAAAPRVPALGHAHAHALDPNAAWFAAVSVLTKEWLYRATKAVADAEHSPVLLANAVHHRSDAYSSAVALAAILGSWYFPALPLDPLGGLLVSVVILQQGVGLLRGAWGDLTDAGASPQTRRALTAALQPLLAPSVDAAAPVLLAVHDLRARHAGSRLFVDLTAGVAGGLTTVELAALEDRIVATLSAARKEVAEVRVRFRPEDREGAGHA